MTPKQPDTKHIGVLDGIRFLCIFFVAWFHFWQQTWLEPVLKGPVRINFYPYLSGGFLFVDMMVLISGFCLFLPYARAILNKEAWPDTKTFYKKRFFRIYPSFAFYILIILIFFVGAQYNNIGAAVLDVVSNLTFLGIHLKASPILAIAGVAWTVMVEVHYYAIFPFLAKAFKRSPFITYTVLCGVGIISCFCFQLNSETSPRFVNHVLTFACVYANGMLGAYLYVWYASKKAHKTATAAIATVVSIACAVAFPFITKHIWTFDPVANGQLLWRFPLSLVFLVFILSTALSLTFYQKIFSNPVTRWFSLISYNFYLWHQMIAVELKNHHIPDWSGDNPPNLTGDLVWMRKYNWTIIFVSFAVAVFTTYLIERPIAKRFRKS